MSDFTGAIDDNPGISQTANRTHTLGNLGTPGSVLLRNRARSVRRLPAVARSIRSPTRSMATYRIFDPNLQVPYAQTWTAGWQRKLTQHMAFEARYVGTRALQSGSTSTTTKPTSSRTDFLDEFRLAQQNLQAHSGWLRGRRNACTSRFAAPDTGTSPLPIFLGVLQRSGWSQYRGYRRTRLTDVPALFANSTFPNPMAMFNQQPTHSQALDATRRHAVRTR